MRHPCFAFFAACTACSLLGTAAFVPPTQRLSNHRCLHEMASISPGDDTSRSSNKGGRKLLKSSSRRIRSASRFVSRKMRGVLWPGSFDADPDVSEPLPPAAPFGCPLLGNNILSGSRRDGPEYFYSKASAELGHPRIWRFFFFGRPCASVSGAAAKSVLQREYSKYDIVSMDMADAGAGAAKKKKRRRRPTALFSTDSVMFERDKSKHQFLRRLVGVALTPAAVARGTPAIVKAAHDQIDAIPSDGSSPVKAQDLAENLALDVAWRQILGLNLEEEEDGAEIDRFRTAVNRYVSGIFNVLVMLPIPGKSVLLSPYRARKYLVSKIESRLDELEESGRPDGSTLSAMLFAEEDDDDESSSSSSSSRTKLSREEVIENALILLVAGTETSASTLTSAMFLLGLHPTVWTKLVDEQRRVCAAHGADVSNKDVLDKRHCPYLDAVVQETLRIVPLSGVNIRRAKETMIIDGTQVPKGHAIFPNIRLTHELDPVTKVGTGEGGAGGKSSNMDPRSGFKPERWLSDDTRPSDDDFFPFGCGPRRCIGYNLAMAEIKIFLALMARRVQTFDLVGTGSKRDGSGSIRWHTKSIIPKPADGVPLVATVLCGNNQS